MARAASLLVRVLSAFVLLLIATWYLLASIPFAYYQFLQSPPWRWMPVFVRIHPLLLVAAPVALVRTLGPLDAVTRRWARWLTIAAATSAACMAAAFWIPGVESYELSAGFCFVPLVLLVGASAIGLAARREAPADMPRSRVGGSPLMAAACAGLAASLPYAVAALVLNGAAVTLQPREIVMGSTLTLVAHVALFAGMALALALVRGAAARWRWSAGAGAAATGAITAVLVAVLMRSGVLTALMFDDRRMIAVAAGIAIGLVTFRMAFLGCSIAETVGRPTRSLWTDLVAYVAAAALLVFVLPPMVRLADWGLTLQKLLVMATWVSAAAWMSGALVGRWPRAAIAGLIALWAVTLGQGVALARSRGGPASGEPRMDAGLAIERYATFDMSLRLILDVVRPVLSRGEFFSTLRRDGDVTDDRRLHAVPLRLVGQPRLDLSYRPHIFIVVVDSLRPDYLSAYDPTVTFTPAIGAFARDSIVMRRAFTAYSGTALSEPALWAGGLIPRLVYVQPFSELNNLERLLGAGGYRRYISVDEVLDVILKDWDGVVRLDEQIVRPDQENEAYHLDFCDTVDDLAQRLDADPRNRPVFFYSQPKNVHIRAIAPKAPSYDRLRAPSEVFFKPAVTAISRLDGCFGRFVANLKRQRLYDDSIIVLTADHGDAYGEEGRWAHAFYVSPETLRIPLVIHLPDRLRATRQWDADTTAWLTDVTPSLYELLGEAPVPRASLMGTSLFSRRGDPPAVARGLQLVQGSYSRIFGLIDADAKWLFAADASRGIEEYFDLTNPRPLRQAMTEANRLYYERALLDRLRELNAYYAPAR